MSKTPGNTLFYGDNLDILRRHVGDETVDLIYLDPPFNSNADYNVLFAEQDGSRAAAQALEGEIQRGGEYVTNPFVAGILNNTLPRLQSLPFLYDYFRDHKVGAHQSSNRLWTNWSLEV